jgi:hypothetical protein
LSAFLTMRNEWHCLAVSVGCPAGAWQQSYAGDYLLERMTAEMALCRA